MNPRKRGTSVEWPTLGLILVTYGAWGLSVINPLALPLWALIPLLSVTQKATISTPRTTANSAARSG